MKKRFFRWILILAAAGAALTLVMAVTANNQGLKEYAEGFGAAQTGRFVQNERGKEYEEGTGYTAAGSRIGDSSINRDAIEGEAGPSGHATFPAGDAWEALAPTADLSEVYRFSGISDDGEQGSANRKEATSIHCTNTSTTNNQVEVQVYQWNGTEVFTGTVNMPPNRTFTFSTQNTTIYFDDVLLGGSPGTLAIYQGTGVVLAESPQVVCSVQVLDPLNYPPVFAVGLEIYKR